MTAAKRGKGKADFPDIVTLSFEEALAELETIVKRLESGRETLDTAIQDYTRGNALKEHCTRKLNEARLQVETIVVNNDGSLSTSDTNFSA